MNWFKKFIIGIIALFITMGNLQGQDINDKLREVFSKVIKAQDPAPFLYDMVVHESDYKWYKAINAVDTLDIDNYWRIYFEMRQASFVPNLLPETFSSRYKAEQIIKKDTIPFGLLNLEFNKLKDDAMDSGVYFGWNDTMLWDISGRTFEPYTFNTRHPYRGTRYDVFLSLPLKGNSKYTDVTFSIDPQFLFYTGIYNSYSKLPPIHNFRINFGDGNGWISFDPSQLAYHTVNYPTAGQYEINVAADVDFATVRLSKSVFTVGSNEKHQYPNTVITEINGIKAGVYYACDNQPKLNKVIIAVSGFDPTESFKIPDIYGQLISKPQIVTLQNYGYDVVCVDWDDSKDDLIANGDRLIALIELLKNGVQNIEDNFVVVGISLGAVVSNYALAKMESPSYRQQIENDSSIIYKDQLHNTRLFLSIDAEYQGAFINVGSQAIAKHITSSKMFGTKLSYTIANAKNNAQSILNILQRPATTQLLKHHIDSTNGNNKYFAHPNREAFLGLMAGYGNHPTQCKVVALSDGLADGSNQVTFGNNAGTESLRYFDIDISTRAYFMYTPVSGFDLHLDLDGYPKQSIHYTSIAKVELKKYSAKISLLCLFNMATLSLVCPNQCPCLKKKATETFIFGIRDMHPWDVAAGGRISIAGSVYEKGSRNGKFSSPFLPIGFSYDVDANAGVISGGLAVGLPGIGGLGVTGHVVTQLESFSFVPYMSALNYTGADSLNQNLMLTPVATNMARTPFDVIIARAPLVGTPPNGYPTTFPNVDFENGHRHWSHYLVQKDEVDTALNLTILTREIGETYMYLDNQRINRRSKFEAEHKINAGYNANPKYSTPSSNTNQYLWKGVNSQDHKFEVLNKGEVQLKAGKEIVLSPGFEVKDSGELHAWIEPMDVCLFTLEELRKRYDRPSEPHPLALDKTNQQSGIRIYPNPAKNLIYIKGNYLNKSLLQLYNLNGQLLRQKTLANSNNSLSLKGLQPGIFLLSIKNGHKLEYFKIIKK